MQFFNRPLSDDLEETRRQVMDHIRQCQKDYERAVAPYLKILSEIEALRGPPYILLSEDKESKSAKGLEDR